MIIIVVVVTDGPVTHQGNYYDEFLHYLTEPAPCRK
jgi:hypothetical protein